MKKLAILGSTGNIGQQALDIVSIYGSELKVTALSSNNNLDLLLEQIEKYKPEAAGITSEEKADILRKKTKVKVYSGETAPLEIAKYADYDMLVNALVGLSGIDATLEAINQKKNIALANKETLVAAGEIVMREARKNNVHIMPIDSEHSALFQCIHGEDPKNIHRIILTCSGGALYNKSKEELENVSLEEALGHKTWKMGPKITIDSATLMNKGFEVIEAMHLYDIPFYKIKVVIHPQSIIHSMVEYSDGSIKAQLSNPDMKLPIQYALSFPERWGCPIERFDFDKNLTFEEPDIERFPCLSYAYDAARIGGTMPAEIVAANDFMVYRFLEGHGKFTDIHQEIRQIMNIHNPIASPTLADIKKAIKYIQDLFEADFYHDY